MYISADIRQIIWGDQNQNNSHFNTMFLYISCISILMLLFRTIFMDSVVLSIKINSDFLLHTGGRELDPPRPRPHDKRMKSAISLLNLQIIA